MRNSTVLVVVAVLILGWFGAEVYSAQNICVTTCVDLSGLNGWEQAIAVGFLPLLLIVAAVRVRMNEKKRFISNRPNEQSK